MDRTTTEAEKKCIEALQKKFPSTVAAADDATFFLPDVYLRYARAHDGKIDAATAAMEATLVWRKTYRPFATNPKVDTPKAIASKFLCVGGDDKKGSTVMVLRLGVPNEAACAERLKLFTYCFEGLAAQGKEYFVIIVDFTLVTNKDPEGGKTRDALAAMLDEHYPERCRVFYRFNAPWFIASAASVMTAFMSAKAKEKLRGCGKTKDLLKDIPEENLPECVGGKFVTADEVDDVFTLNKKA